MSKLGLADRLMASTALLLSLASCAADSVTTRGAGGDDAVPPRFSSGALPARLANTLGGDAEYQGAAYPIAADPPIVTLQAKLLASDGAPGDHLGQSVSVSGDTAIVGAPDEAAGIGAAHVFVRSGTSWTEQATLLAGDGAAGDQFGQSVSVSGDTAIVGAGGNATFTGAAYVFVRSGTSWTKQATLLAGNGAANDYFGISVSVSGDTAIVGAFYTASGTGAAYAFARSGTSWTEQAILLAGDGAANDYFGISVSVSGDTALVGAEGNTSFTGAAYAFVRSGTSWSEQAKLTTSDGAANDYVGISVSLSGDTALVGTYNNNSGYVFVRAGTAWSEQAKLTASDTAPGDQFGQSLSVSGDTLLVGAWGRATSTGAAYVFQRDGTSWAEQAKLTASDGAPGDVFGYSVSASGDTLLAGAWGQDGYAGAAYVLVLQKAQGAPCDGAAQCASGLCTDGVCCNVACTPGPCGACSMAAGAPVDGTCTLLSGPACDDGQACNGAAQCQAGECSWHAQVCDDGGPGGGGGGTAGAGGAGSGGAGSGGSGSGGTSAGGSPPGGAGGEAGAPAGGSGNKAGSAGQAVTPPPGAVPGEEGGWGCRTVPRRDRSGSAVGALLGLAALRARRKRPLRSNAATA